MGNNENTLFKRNPNKYYIYVCSSIRDISSVEI